MNSPNNHDLRRERNAAIPFRKGLLLLELRVGLLLMAGLMGPATAAKGRRSPDLPRYTCHRATGPIEIDGRIEEPAWGKAQAVTFQFPWEKASRLRCKTIARALWDDKDLYISFDCPDDPDLTARYTRRDDPTYEEDTVEVFIMADPNQPTSYIGLEMNCLGTLYDYLVVQKRLYAQFDLKGVRLKARINGTVNRSDDHDRGWSLEVMIPLEDFKELTPRFPPKPGTVWRFNLYRLDGLEPDRQYSLWSDVKTPAPNYHVPGRFGYLVFAN